MTMFRNLTKMYRQNRTRAILNALSDRQLDDIGVNRADISRAGSVAWFVPSNRPALHIM